MKYWHTLLFKRKGKIRVSKEIKEAWEKAEHCHCGDSTCSPETHRLCPECKKIMIFNSYFMSPEPTYNEFRWKVELINPREFGGKDISENRQAIHLKCSNEKGRHFIRRVR